MSKRLAEIEMLTRIEFGGARRADPADFLVRRLVGTVGNVGGGNVRQARERFVDRPTAFTRALLAGLHAVLERANLGDDRAGVLAPPLRGADLLRLGVALGLQRLGLGDRLAPRGVEHQQRRRLRLHAAPRHAGVERLRVVTNGFDVEHRLEHVLP